LALLVGILLVSLIAATQPALAQTSSQNPPGAEQPEDPIDVATDNDDEAPIGEDADDSFADSDEAEFEMEDLDLDDIKPPPQSFEGETVEEITVTGTKTATTQSEPVAVTTFEQEDLDVRGIMDAEALALNVPALHFGQVGQQAVLTLRGIGLENLTSVGEAGVGFQVDGVHMGRPSAATSIFYDLMAVNVLRGPQGTQGGRNTTAGRVELWSKPPREEFEASGDISFGNYGSILPRAVVNLPIIEEKLLTRTSVIYETRDGYQDFLFTGDESDNADDAKNLAVRAQAASSWFDQLLELRAIGSYSFQRGNGPANHLIGPPPDSLTRGETVTKIRIFPESQQYLDVDCPNPKVPGYVPEACVTNDPRQTYAEAPFTRDNSQNGITGLLTYDSPFLEETLLSNLRFRFIGAHHQNIEDSIIDFDGTNIPDTIFDLRRDSTQNSFEVYAERMDVDWLDYKLGFYYFDEKINSSLCFDGAAISNAFDLAFIGDIRTSSMAGYADIGLHPNEDVRLWFNARYTDEEKSADQINFFFNKLTQAEFDAGDTDKTYATGDDCGAYFQTLLNDPTNVPGRPGAVIVEDFKPDGRTFQVSPSDSWSDFTPAVGVDWQMSASSTASLSATNGFKAGGFPLGADTSLAQSFQDAYGAEEVWNYELTFKNDFDFFDGSARLNLTFFWTEYNPFQICQFSGPNFNCRDDGDATIRGVEFEWVLSPIEGLLINGFFNYIDAKVNDFWLLDPAARDCTFYASDPLAQTLCLAGRPAFPERRSANPMPENVSGNQLPKAPSWAGAFGIEYEIPLGRFGAITPRFQLQYQAKTFFRIFNREEFSQDPFVKLDASIRWWSESQRFYAEFFGRNLTDVDVINSMLVGPQASGGQVLGQYQPPRLFGIKLGIGFISDLF